MRRRRRRKEPALRGFPRHLETEATTTLWSRRGGRLDKSGEARHEETIDEPAEELRIGGDVGEGCWPRGSGCRSCRRDRWLGGSARCRLDNSQGQARVPADLRTTVAIAAGEWHTVALKQDGTVACWGDNNYGQCNTPANLGHRHRNRRGRQSHPRDPHRRKRQPPLRHELRHPRCWHPRRSERRHAARRAIRGG